MKKYDLTGLARLADIQANEDIQSLSHAIFPGTHCPLFGVAMIASFIEDLVVLVVGTQECTYYAKDFAHLRQKGRDNFYSAVASKHDITFGCEEKIKEIIIDIDQKIKPKAIMIVTTCVMELIGEDFEAMGQAMSHEVAAKLLVVPTEHFKCNSHIPGMERCLEKLVTLMEPQEKRPKTVNILGHRQHGIEETELIKLLREEGVDIHSVVPSSCTIAELSQVPGAQLNIVTDFVALPLAKAMKRDFDIDYIYFDRHLSIHRIKACYARLESALEIKLLDKLQGQEAQLRNLMEEARAMLKDKTFIYGNTPMMALEVASFLCDLDMTPLLVQVRELYENDGIYMDEIKEKGQNPYISRIANIAPMQSIYDQLKPDFYIGHENPMNLIKRNIVQITLDDATKKLGFEIPLYAIKKIMLSYGQQEEMKAKMMAMASKGGMRHGAI
ncbi:nitrogenase component 1 [Alkaliphilus crotonatoxidans]